jgi:hypothetical protein
MFRVPNIRTPMYTGDTGAECVLCNGSCCGTVSDILLDRLGLLPTGACVCVSCFLVSA